MFAELLDKLAVAINQNRSECCEKATRYNELQGIFRTMRDDTPSEYDDEFEKLDNELSRLQRDYERMSYTFDLIRKCQLADNVLDIAYVLSEDSFNNDYS